MPKGKFLLVIAGPTAVGKTELSIRLAKHFNAEILSADSRQMFREMSIGTAKPGTDELSQAKHHFIDHISIHDPYTAGTFEKEALEKLDSIFHKNDVAILCGGSGLYIDAVCNGFDEGLMSDAILKKKIKDLYAEKGMAWLQEEVKKKDPEYFSSADIKNPHRLMRALEVIKLSGKPYSSFRQNEKQTRGFTIIKILVNEDREKLYEKINRRVDKMFEKGLLKEVESLYPHRHLNALNTVGYKELFDYIEGKCSLEKANDLIKQHTRNYAKRQLTWFRKDTSYEVFEPSDFDKIRSYVEIILEHS
jgi:tRNA dimethylallyltransferase